MESSGQTCRDSTGMIQILSISTTGFQIVTGVSTVRSTRDAGVFVDVVKEVTFADSG